MITNREVIPYLRRRGLLEPSGTKGAPVVMKEARRNLVFTVPVGSEGGMFLKQGVGPERSVSVANEAAVYRRLSSDGSGALDRYLPRCVAYDADRHILTLELIANARNLRDYHAQRGHFSITLARALGDALGTLHRRSWRDGPRTPVFSEEPPWVLSLHRPNVNLLAQVSSANVQLIKTIQDVPELCRFFDAVREEWKPTTLIHNDVRWDNCVVYPAPGTRRHTRLKLVDWELAQLGDPLWDAGCVLSDYLSFWLLSIPITGEAAPDRFMSLSRYPLTRMQPAIRAFWRSYVDRMEPPSGSADDWLLRATRYAAARLVQTGFEHTQTSPYLAASVICLLQLSLNMLEQTQEAAAELLGIEMTNAVTP